MPLDIDECVLNTDGCEQLCNNTNGLYGCFCHEDFYLAPNGRNCIPVCGGNFNQSYGTFRSPGWPNFYPRVDIQCQWIINIPENATGDGPMSLQFTFDSTAYGLGKQSICSQDHFEFYIGVGAEWRLVEKICPGAVPSPFNITSTTVRVVFRGSPSQQDNKKIGANVSFKAVERGKTFLNVINYDVINL